MLPPNVLKNSIPLSNDAAIAARRDDRADRMAVAEWLADHDDVGHDALILERPEARAHAAEPVCTSSAMHTPPAARTCRYTSARYPGGSTICPPTLGHVSAMNAATTGRAGIVDDRRRHARVLRARVGVVALVRAAIIVRQRRDVHPIGRARAARTSMLVRADVDERRRVAVIRRLEHDHVRAPGVRTRESQRQLVRLAGRSSRKSTPERRGQRRSQALGIFVRDVVQYRVFVLSSAICSAAASTTRGCAVADVRDVVVRVDVSAATSSNRYCIQPRTIFDRIAIRDAQVASDRASTCREDGGRVASARGNRSAGSRTMRLGSGDSSSTPTRCARAAGRRRESRCRGPGDPR